MVCAVNVCDDESCLIGCLIIEMIVATEQEHYIQILCNAKEAEVANSLDMWLVLLYNSWLLLKIF